MSSTSRLRILDPAALSDLADASGRFQVMVRVVKGFERASLDTMTDWPGGRVEGMLVSETSALANGKGSIYVLSFPDTPLRDTIVSSISRRPGIEMVEVDSEVSALLISTDTAYANGTLWGMLGPANDGIGAFSNAFGTGADVAWARADVSADGKVGSMRTVVGVLDTGIDPLHPDLYLNVWINQKSTRTE